MHAIQENEIDQLRELTAFLDLEMNFVGQYLEVLKNLRSEWPDKYAEFVGCLQFPPDSDNSAAPKRESSVLRGWKNLCTYSHEPPLNSNPIQCDLGHPRGPTVQMWTKPHLLKSQVVKECHRRALPVDFPRQAGNPKQRPGLRVQVRGHLGKDQMARLPVEAD